MDVRARRADLARPPGRRLAGSLHGTREMSAAADRPTDPGRPARQAFTVGVGPPACPGAAVGALVGAVYGAVAEIVPRATAAAGLPFGVAIWLGAHVIAVPALDLAEPPIRRPVDKEAEEFGLHLIYGMTTELVRRLLS